MKMAIMGRKCGMTRQFDEDGCVYPITVVELYENQRVTQIKTVEKEGYDGVQVAYGNKKSTKLSKALKGHYAKAGVNASCGLYELRAEQGSYQLGDDIDTAWLDGCEFVDVSGQTQGKGFAGTVKRHHFKTQDATHGNSLSHRAPGSIGQNQTPGRVFKGKKMAGHMGNRRVTIQSLKKVSFDSEKRLLLIKGSLPGAVGSRVLIRPATKKIKT